VLLGVAERQSEQGTSVPVDVLLTHALGAGERAKSFRYSVVAARRSIELGGESEAEVHVERALDLWSSDAGIEERAELLLEHGRLLHWAVHDLQRAAETLAQARALFLQIGESARAALATALWASARWWFGERSALDDLRAANSESPRGMPPHVRL